MATSGEIILRKIQYDPSTGEGAVHLEHDMGVLLPPITEAALEAYLETPGANWGNAEVLKVAQAWIDAHEKFGGKGYVVVIPPPPVPPYVPPPAPGDEGQHESAVVHSITTTGAPEPSPS